jgi:hypothetical protein
MPTAREFWTTKSPLPEYHAITFDHPEFDAPFRLVANQFAEVTLGGDVYTPAPMTISPPDQKSDAQPKLNLVFPRQVVGRQFKQQLKLIAVSGSRAPITVTYDVYLGVTGAPKLSWILYASEQGGIQFSTDAVQVTATDDNPMRRQVGVIYDPATFTGLEIMQ